MKKIVIIIFLFIALFQSSSINAQDLLKSTDLSTLKVDSLSESDIVNLKAQLQSNNMTIEQAEPIALSKGMSATEFAKLKVRVVTPATSVTNSATVGKTEGVSSRKQEAIVNTKIKGDLNPLIFGSELFDSPTLNFEPNLKLATPVNYILGPGDELQVSVYGVQEFNASIPVSIEGKISIQNVGQISVSGMTIEAATQKIKAAIARVFSTVSSGQSQVSVTLSRIRTIKITLIGSAQPGNYSISSLSTVYNALFVGGGPGKDGSYRNIELIRGNKVFRTIDIYRFLVNGDQSDNVGLKDNDVIRIPSYKLRVTMEGEIKRAGIFEMKSGETFTDLLSYASGFNDLAYTASVTVVQKTAKEFKVRDIKQSEYNSYKPLAGDVFQISKILNRFENRIQINGAVFRPNTYSFYEGMRVSNLIAKADGLKEDAYTKRARIIRLKPDLTTEIVQINLAKVIEGDENENITLRKEDVVTIYSILDFVEDYVVTIDGEIKKPGQYDYYQNLSLNDLLIQAGGLTGSASKRVEIARMIKAETIDDANPNKVELYSLEITPENNEQLKNFELVPFDIINIRKMAVYDKPEMVTINGAVNYPGKYVLATKKEKVYDVINRAGGLTSLANIEGVKVKRPIQQAQIEELKSVNFSITKKDKDTINNKVIDKLVNKIQYLTIPVDWTKIIKNQDELSNITLLPNDVIEIVDFSEGVKVSGNILLNSEIPYVQGRGLNYYLNSAGGMDAKGWKRKAYIIYPNGKANVASRFLFINSFPKVTPGSQIVIPERPESKKMSTAEIVSVGSIFISIAGIISTFLLLKR